MYEITVTVELNGPGGSIAQESVSEFVDITDGVPSSLIGDTETLIDEFVAEVEFHESLINKNLGGRTTNTPNEPRGG